MTIVSEYDWESDTYTHNPVGHTNGTAPVPQGGFSAYDADLDTLYAWVAPPTPPAAPLPEAAFSLTLKGRLDGQEALLTARGATAAEFRTNLEAIRGLLDAVPAKASPQAPTQDDGAPQCPQHGTMRKGKRGWFCPVKVGDSYCTYAVKA